MSIFRRGGVFNAVMEQGGHHRVQIQLQVGYDFRHGDGVDDIGLAALAQLSVVGGVGVGKGVVQPFGVQIGHVALYLLFQRMIALQNGVHIVTSV